MRDQRTRVVLAPDKFKGTATADEVADALERGMRRARPGLDVRVVPVADGGEGTIAAAVAAGFVPVEVDASGPLGDPVRAHYARRDELAVVELAQVCGLPMLPDGRPDALASSSYGLGEVVLHAAQAGCRTVVIGLGGSASTDGGVGLLQALGVSVRDRYGSSVTRGGGALGGIVELDLTGNRLTGLQVELLVAADVSAPLYGPGGAAYLFAPQKGATPELVAELDRGLRHWAAVAETAVGSDLASTPGAGAAGGVGFAALLVGARMVSGVEYLLDLAGFDDVVRGAALVVTGEGSLDEQSLTGKVPIGVARAAGRLGVPTVAVAGRCAIDVEQLTLAGIARAYSLAERAGSTEAAMRRTIPLLEEIGEQIAASLPA